MGLSFGHLLILTFVILIFGSRRLPGLGTALGKGMRAFKQGLEGGGTELEKKKSEDEDRRV